MKILVLGDAGHGKDEVSRIIARQNSLVYRSTSLIISDKIVNPILAPKYDYESYEECYEDRDNHREEWFNIIEDYVEDDKTKLVKEVLRVNDFYIGLRDKEQLEQCRDLFDIVIGVFNPHKKKESIVSNNINVFADSDLLLYNDKGLVDLEKQVYRVMRYVVLGWEYANSSGFKL